MYIRGILPLSRRLRAANLDAGPVFSYKSSSSSTGDEISGNVDFLRLSIEAAPDNERDSLNIGKC